MGRRKTLLDVLLPLYQQYYVPNQAIAVDESVISFKGQVGFKQYLKGKPRPWGIKAFALADSTNGCLYVIMAETLSSFDQIYRKRSG